MFLEYLYNGLINGSTITVTALGFALVYNTFRIFHIAYAALYTLAGFIIFTFSTLWSWPLLWSLIVAVLLVALVSWLLDKGLYVQLGKRTANESYIMLASVGAFIILTNILGLIFGNQPRMMGEEVRSSWLPHWLDIRTFILIINLLLILFFVILMKFTRIGLMLRAVRDNKRLSAYFGMNAGVIRSLVFLISGLLVAFAGAFQCMDVGVHPYTGLPVFISAFIAMVIGGIGRYEGVILGGFLLGILQSFADYFTGSQWVVVITFLVLFVFLIFKPEGIIPEKERGI